MSDSHTVKSYLFILVIIVCFLTLIASGWPARRPQGGSPGGRLPLAHEQIRIQSPCCCGTSSCSRRGVDHCSRTDHTTHQGSHRASNSSGTTAQSRQFAGELDSRSPPIQSQIRTLSLQMHCMKKNWLPAPNMHIQLHPFSGLLHHLPVSMNVILGRREGAVPRIFSHLPLHTHRF